MVDDGVTDVGRSTNDIFKAEDSDEEDIAVFILASGVADAVFCILTKK